MKNKLKSLLALALAAFTSLTWAAELVIPYSFDGKAGNTEIPFEYKVVMPNTALTSFTTTVRYAGGSHRVEILSVKLLDGETEYTAVATGTEGTEVVVEGASYSGGNNYHNIYTFTNEAGFTANKVYTLQAMLKVTNDPPSHNGNIKVTGGLICLTPTYWASFDNSNVSSDKVWSSGGISFGGSASYGYVPVLLGNKAFDLSNDAWGQQTFLSANPTAFTLSLNAKTGTAANGILIAFGSKNSTGGLVVRRGADGNEIIVTKAKSTDAIITANAPGSSVGYTNIVLTYGNGTLSLYINGDLAGTANVTAGELIPESNFQLGRRHGGLVDSTKEAKNVNGAIDELVAWNGTALTADQVKAFYNENYAGVLKNNIALAYEFEETDAATVGNMAWEWNSPSAPNSSVSATYVNSPRKNADSIAYKSIILNKDVHPGMGYTWANEFTVAAYVNLANCKDDGTIVSIGADLLLRKIDSDTLALCNNGSTQYVSADNSNLSVGYHLVLVKKTATSLSLQIDDGTAQEVALTEENSPVMSTGLQLGVRWGNGYASYDETDVEIGPLLDDFLVWNSTLSNESIATLCNTYPEVVVEESAVSPEGNGLHKLSDLITNGLKTGANVIATVTLADGATLEIDTELNFSVLNIVSDGAITIKVTNLAAISQAQLDATLNTENVKGVVTNSYKEQLNGYTVDDVTYSLVYRGPADGWGTASNWYTGYRTNGETTYWIPYSGNIPAIPNGNFGAKLLIDGELIGEKITVDEDGYKVVNTPTLEGWTLELTVTNGVHVKIPTLNKLQGGCAIHVDDTSKITVTDKGYGDNAANNAYYIDAENGLEFVNMPMPTGTAYLGLAGSIVTHSFDANDGPQTIGGVTLDLGDSTLTGRKVVTRTLYTYTSGTTFSVAEGAVTTSVDTVTPEAADILQNVGQYKFEQKADGYYVSYVAYAEADEIGAMNTWTATVDGNWATAGNWSSDSVPAEGETVEISIKADTTISIPAEGVSVDTLLVSGKGTLTIAGGKITAAKVIMDGTGVTATQETLDAAVVQGTQKTECLTFDVAEDKAFTMLVKDCTLTKKGVAKLEFKKPASTAIFDTVNVTLEKGELALVLGDDNSDPLIADTTFTYVDADSNGEADGSLTNWGWVHSTTTTTFVVPENVTGKAFVGGNLTDTGAVIKRGDGVLLLGITANQNAGTYAGTTTIEAGMINYRVSGGATLSGVISGEGKVGLAAGTLTLTANNTYTGGTVIAEGATVSVRNLNTIFGTGNVTGAGTVKIAGGTYTGLSLAQYTDANTTIEIPADNTVTGYFNNAIWTCAAKIRLNGTLSLTNGFGAGRYTFTGPWTGAGAISLSHTSPQDAIRITGDISGFTGNLSVTGARAITFCAESTAFNQKYGGKICVHGDYAYTAKVNGTWSAPVVVENGATIGGTGTIDNTLTFANGATIDGSVAATGDVTLNGTVNVSGEAGATVLTCANAASLDLTKFAAPEGLKCVADGNTVKLAVANVPFNPATAESMSVEVAAANADDAMAMVVIQRPEGVGDAVVSAEDYAAYFTKTATGENGTFTVTVSLKDDVKPVVGTTDDADDAFTVDADGVTIAINNYKPGLYYGIRSATELGALKTVGAVGVDVKEDKITVDKLTGDSAFYQVVVDVKPFPSVNDGAEGDAPESE